MGFNQITFIFAFLPVSVLIYLIVYRISDKNLNDCNAVLLWEGVAFFAWMDLKSVIVCMMISALVYGCVAKLEKTLDKRERKRLMHTVFSLSVLIFIIYRALPDFFIDVETRQTSLFKGVMVPMTVTFFCMGLISYVMDVYRGKASAGRLSDLLDYMIFFPKLICGPFVSWSSFNKQLREREITIDGIAEGSKKIIIGLAKKVILADTFAAQISLIDSKSVEVGADVPTMWLRLALLFLVMLLDLSGYMDIAGGISQIMGFDIGRSFDHPYSAISVSDFWRKWNISVGTWFREYVYIPLGGNRRGNTYINLLDTFLIAGVWHGFSTTFALWGMINGIVVVAEHRLSKSVHIQKAIRHIITLLLISAGWILFNSQDLASAGAMFKALVIPTAIGTPNFTWQFYLTKRIAVFMLISVLYVAGAIEKVAATVSKKMSETSAALVEKVALLLLLFADLMFALGTQYTPFIYSVLK